MQLKIPAERLLDTITLQTFPQRTAVSKAPSFSGHTEPLLE